MAEDTPTAEAPSSDPAHDADDLAEMAVEIAAAYVRNNPIPAGDVPALLAAVHGALASLGSPEAAPAPEPQKPQPPVPIRKTVTDDAIISLEDGKPYKTLKRHLAKRGLTPADYRAKWGLPADYPIVAPAFARQRSELARTIGLGAMRRKGSQPDDEAEG